MRALTLPHSTPANPSGQGGIPPFPGFFLALFCSGVHLWPELPFPYREALTFLSHDVLGLDVGDLPCPEPPRLLHRLRRACRVRQFSPRTENCYAMWAERFIRFHGLRQPNTMGAPEIEHFRTDLAADGQVTGSVKVYAGS